MNKHIVSILMLGAVISSNINDPSRQYPPSPSQSNTYDPPQITCSVDPKWAKRINEMEDKLRKLEFDRQNKELGIPDLMNQPSR